MASLQDLIKKAQQSRLGKAIGNLSSNFQQQQAQASQNRANFARPIQQAASNVSGNVRAISSPQTRQDWFRGSTSNNVSYQAVNEFTKPVQWILQGAKKAIVAPIEYAYNTVENQTDERLANTLRNQQARAMSAGNIDAARNRARLIEENQQRQAGRTTGFGQEVLQARNKAAAGVLGTGLTALGLTAGVPTLLGTAALSGVMGYGGTKLSGGTDLQAQEAFGQGIGKAPQYAGINKLTAPLVSNLLSPVAARSLSQRVFSHATVNALTNVAEDYALSKASQEDYGSGEVLSSLGTGAVLGGVSGASPEIRRFIGQFANKVGGKVGADGFIRNKSGQLYDPGTGRWVKETTSKAVEGIKTKQKQLVEYVGGNKYDPNDFTLTNRPDGTGMDLSPKAQSRLKTNPEAGFVDPTGMFQAPYGRGDITNLNKRIDDLIGYSAGEGNYKKDFAVRQSMISNYLGDPTAPPEFKKELQNAVDQVDLAQDAKLNPQVHQPTKGVEAPTKPWEKLYDRKTNDLIESYAKGEEQANKLQDIPVDFQLRPKESNRIQAEIEAVEVGKRYAVKQIAEKLGISEYEALEALSTYIDAGKRRGGRTVADFYKWLPEKLTNPVVARPVSDPLEALQTESRKYKSADEFVKAQGKPVYHGTSLSRGEEIMSGGFKPYSKIPRDGGNGYNYNGQGTYFVDSPDAAKDYGQSIVETYIPKNLKILEDANAPTWVKEDTSAEALTARLRAEGYDGVKVPVPGSKEFSVVIFDPEKLKTKSQLTGIYNQATTASSSKLQTGNIPPVGQATPVEFTQPSTKPGKITKTRATKAASSAAKEAERLTEIANQVKQKLDIAQPGKARGFTTSVQEAPNVSKKVKTQVSSTYIPKSNDVLMGEAKALLQDGVTLDTKNVENIDQKIAATIQEALNQQKAGNNKAAANLYNNLSETGTELGRGVHAFSLLQGMTPEAISASVAGRIKKYNAKLGSTSKARIPELTGEQVKLIADQLKIADSLTGREKQVALNELNKTINSFIPSSLVDKVITIWKAGLLTSLRTHERNLVGNTIHQVGEISKDYIASPVDALLSLKTGNRTVTATTKGLGEGFSKKTGRQVLDLATTGYDPSEQLNKFDYKQVNWGTSKLGKVAEAYTNAVFRTLGAADKPFYNAAMARSLYDQAGAAAMNAGKQGDKQFIESLVKSPTDEMLKTAINDANVATFKNETMASNAANAIKRSLAGNPYGKFAGEFFMPFTGVPSSVFTQLKNYSPIGLVQGIAKAGKVLAGQVPELQRQASQEVGRGVIGTGLFGLGAYLMSKGLMTGQPQDAQEARQWETENKPRNSILIPGIDGVPKWRSLNSIGPEAFIMLSGAKFQEEMSRQDGSIGTYAGNVGKDMLDQSFVTGIQAPVNAITDPARYGKSYVGNSVSSFVPNIVKDTSKAFDTSAREANTITDYAKLGIPGVRNTLIEKRGPLGEVMPQEPTGAAAYFDLFNSKTPISNPVVDELSRLNEVGNNSTPSKMTPSQTILKQKVKLTYDQLNRLEAGVGEQLRPRLSQLITSPAYQQLDDESKAKAIDNTVQDVRKKYKNLNAGQITATAGSKSLIPSSSAQTTPTTDYSYVDQDGNYKTIDISKVMRMPEATGVDKLKKTQETFATVDKVISSDMSDEQKQSALSELGISQKDAEYYSIAKENNDIKTANAYDKLDQSKSFDDFMKYLVNGRKPVNGKILVSDGVIDNLVDDGVIPYALGKELKNIDLDSSGKVKSGKGKARGKASEKALTARKNALNQLGEDLKKVSIGSGKIRATSGSGGKINTKALTFSGR
jgi:hypothetical protein